MIVLLLLPLIQPIAGHGNIFHPKPRNMGDPVGIGEGTAFWWSESCAIGCDCTGKGCPKVGCDPRDLIDWECAKTKKATNTNPAHLTITGKSENQHFTPWNWPGSAKVLNPCGVAGGAYDDNTAASGGYYPMSMYGFNGTDLPPVKDPLKLERGTVQMFGWTVAANHGGGYQYRLCPKEEGKNLTEECFQANPMKYHNLTQFLVWHTGDKSPFFDATEVTEGVVPEGSVWRRNPIPPCAGPMAGVNGMNCTFRGKPNPSFPPPPGCDETCWGYQPCYFPHCTSKTKEIPSIVDFMEIPEDMTPGDYVVSLRWDVEHTNQIWQNCADVVVV